MSNKTRSHLNLQEYHISDLLYCSPSRILINSYPGCEQSGTHLLPQQNSLITMVTSRTPSESGKEKKTGDGMPSSDSKSAFSGMRFTCHSVGIMVTFRNNDTQRKSGT
jgi:hypothetical protein